jgi:hypothetical protein
MAVSWKLSMKFIYRLFVSLFFLCIISDAFSTSYKSPEKYVVVSKNTEYLARIIPADNPYEKTKPSMAQIYKLNGKNYSREKEFILINDFSPSMAYLSEDGILITVKDFGPFYGVGHDLVIYSAQGKPVYEYNGQNFFSESELKKIQMPAENDDDTVLSELPSWICLSGGFYLDEGKFTFEDATGRTIIIDIHTGKFIVRHVGGNKCKR